MLVNMHAHIVEEIESAGFLTIETKETSDVLHVIQLVLVLGDWQGGIIVEVRSVIFFLNTISLLDTKGCLLVLIIRKNGTLNVLNVIRFQIKPF